MYFRGACARLLWGFACCIAALGAYGAATDNYPNRPIRYISPYAPGGSTTYTARLIGQQLTDAWGQQVVVDNRPGANTIIGTRLALTSPPDGYTLVSIGATLAANHTLVKTPYDATKDVTCIATVLSYESVLVVPPSLPATSVKDLVAMAKAQPGRISFGTSSVGGPTHLLAELFSLEAGIKTLHVPYKGGGPAVADLMGGHIHFFFSNPVNVAAQIQSGRLRPLAVTGQSRVAAWPHVPTFIEQGLPGITLSNWQGVGGPTGMPKTIVDRLSAEIQKLVSRPDTKEKLNKVGFEPYYNNSEQTTALLRADIGKYANIIKAANIRVE